MLYFISLFFLVVVSVLLTVCDLVTEADVQLEKLLFDVESVPVSSTSATLFENIIILNYASSTVAIKGVSKS